MRTMENYQDDINTIKVAFKKKFNRLMTFVVINCRDSLLSLFRWPCLKNKDLCFNHTMAMLSSIQPFDAVKFQVWYYGSLYPWTTITVGPSFLKK